MINIDELESKIKQYLDTCDDERNYWDGVFASDKDIAFRYLLEDGMLNKMLNKKSFLEWLRDNND